MASYKMNFNQDFNSISVLSAQTLRLFSIQSMNRIEEIYSKDVTEHIRIVERLFGSSLVVFVSEEQPNCIKMLHYKKKQNICNCFYPSEILCVRMNRVRLVVCLAESIHIHDIRDMKTLHSIENIAPNEFGLCALSLNSNLAFPICMSTGELRVFNTERQHTGMTIRAHDTPLSALTFSPSGELLATASERGTVIRVFCVKNGQKVQEFRRGVKRTVRIASLVFSPAGDFLVAASNTETVHVFKIDAKAVQLAEMKPIAGNAVPSPVLPVRASSTNTKNASAVTSIAAPLIVPTVAVAVKTTSSAAPSVPTLRVAAPSVATLRVTARPVATLRVAAAPVATPPVATPPVATPPVTTPPAAIPPVTTAPPPAPASWTGYLSKAVSSYLIPTQVSEVLAQDRAFATAVLTQPGLKHICGLTKIGQELMLLVACEDGFLYMHEFNAERGGVCKQKMVHDLRGVLEGVIELNLSESMSMDTKTLNKQESSETPSIPTTSKLLKSCGSSVLIENPDPTPDNSYAAILRGNQTASAMSDSAKFRKLVDAIDTPTKLYDERQFPPVAIAAKD